MSQPPTQEHSPSNEQRRAASPHPSSTTEPFTPSDEGNVRNPPPSNPSPRRNPITLNELFGAAEIRDAVIRQGNFNYRDIRQLEAAGVRAYLTVDQHRRVRGEENRCDCTINFAEYPRPSPRPGLTGPIGPCPYSDLTCPDVRQCDGSFEHPGVGNWDHANVHTLFRMPALVPAQGGILHPPGVQPPRPFAVCIQCYREGLYRFRYANANDDTLRKRVTDNWVPFCELHSLFISDKWDGGWPDHAQRNEAPPQDCRCVEDINRGWSCRHHRDETTFLMGAKATYHKDYLRQQHFRRHRPRVRYGSKKKKKIVYPTEADIEKLDSMGRRHSYQGARHLLKAVPGCPSECCVKPSWNVSGEPRRRIAKCLGCGGLVRCRGKVGDLSIA